MSEEKKLPQEFVDHVIERGDEIMNEEEKYPEIEVVGHSMMHGDGKHEVLNLEQNKYIPDDEGVPTIFETWVCMHRKCNYLEYRLKEGHRENR